MPWTGRMAERVRDEIAKLESLPWERRLYGRLRRLRKLDWYLRQRLAREAEAPEEQEAFGLIWPPVVYGGEA